MKKEDNKVDFDLSALTLEDLVKVYEEITEFLQFLSESKIIQEEKAEDDDE